MLLLAGVLGHGGTSGALSCSLSRDDFIVTRSWGRENRWPLAMVQEGGADVTVAVLQGTYITTSDPVVERLARAELRAVDPELEVTRLEPGIMQVTTRLAPHVWSGELARREDGLDLIFVRHMQAADYRLTGSRSSPPAPAELAARIGHLLQAFAELLAPATRVAVHARRAPAVLGMRNSQLRDALGERLAALLHVTCGPTEPQVIVSLYAHAAHDDAWHLYVGAAPAAFHLSPWPGGRVTFRRAPDMVSRAQFKLLEAAQRFGLDLEAGGQALDLGAAPGGWSWELGRRGWQVTAVDPAPLAPQVSAIDGVRQHRITAEELPVRRAAYDLMLCDINWDPQRSARALVRLAPVLRPGGRGLFLLKWMAEEPPLAGMARVFAVLEPAYRLLRAKHLFYNRGEVSVLLAPHPPAP